MEDLNKQKAYDTFTKKYLKELTYERPSKDFTAQVIQRLQEQESMSKIPATPLISLSSWIGIAISLVVGLGYALSFESKGWFSLPELDLSFLKELSFSLPTFELSLSQTMVYCVAFFGSLLLFQLVALRGFYQKV